MELRFVECRLSSRQRQHLHKLAGSQLLVTAVSGGIAYAYGASEWLVVDLAAGAVIARRSSLPVMLVP